jgi:hypothetical protein
LPHMLSWKFSGFPKLSTKHDFIQLPDIFLWKFSGFPLFSTINMIVLEREMMTYQED